MHGSLKTKSFPRLLCELWQGELTGILCLQRRLVEKRLFFKKGKLIQAESNLLHETVGHYLVKEDIISEQELQRSVAKAEETGKRVGEMIVEKGFVDPLDFYAALRKLVTIRAVDCFLWDDGSYEFKTDDFDLDGLLALNIDPFHVLIQGIHTAMPFERMRQDITLILNKPVRVTHAKLPKWADGYLNTMAVKLLKAFHEPKKPRFVMQDLNIEEEVMLRIVYAFDVTGLIINTETTLAEEASEIAPVFDISESSEESSSASSSAAKELPTRSAAEEAALQLDEEQSNTLVNEVLALSLRLDSVTHFELLDMEESATVTEVRIGYVKFLEKFSLAYFKQGPLAEYRDKVEDILLASAEAFADLRDASSKTAYVDKLKAKRQAEKTDRKKKPGASFAIKTALLDANEQFAEGLRHLERRNYENAIKYFEYSRDIDGRDPLYSAYLAWSKFQHDMDGNALEATELFEQSIKTGSNNPKINMLYGKFEIAQGNSKKGLSYLRKAAGLSPKDLEIQRAFRIAKSEAEKK